MSELRRNPITGHWVIMAENRGQRPQEVVLQQVVQDQFECPFCEGREERTPGETLARRAAGSKPDGLGWRVRRGAQFISGRGPAIGQPPKRRGGNGWPARSDY